MAPGLRILVIPESRRWAQSPSCIARQLPRIPQATLAHTLAGLDAHQLWRADDGIHLSLVHNSKAQSSYGREPDETRYDFDAHQWNSRAARLWVMPNGTGLCKLVTAFLRVPENQEPDVDVRRTTASLQYNRKFNRRQLASAFIWGRNHRQRPDDGIIQLNSYTAESTGPVSRQKLLVHAPGTR
jgi:hypothetical protein